MTHEIIFESFFECPRPIMEEDVESRDEDGVDGRGVYRWDGRVCGLGVVGASSILGLIRGPRAFDDVIPTLVLGSRMQLAHSDNGRRRPDEGFGFTCRLGCWWSGRRLWVERSPITFV